MSVTLAVTLWFIAAFFMILGNTAGYHRLLTHRSYRTRPFIRNALTLFSALHSGSAVLWVGVHRVHHAFSDSEADPHPTSRGFWYAHSGWLLFGVRHPVPCILFALSGFGLQITYLINDVRRLLGLQKPYWRKMCRDLMKEPLMVFLDTPLVIPALFAAQVALAWWLGGWWGILWLWALHVVQNNASWVINSICHWPGFGVQARDAGDRSRNVAWLGWLTHGDSFHNNHHRYPASARHALDGGMDLSWGFICLLNRIGLADDVRLPDGFDMPPWSQRQPTPADLPS